MNAGQSGKAKCERLSLAARQLWNKMKVNGQKKEKYNRFKKQGDRFGIINSMVLFVAKAVLSCESATFVVRQANGCFNDGFNGPGAVLLFIYFRALLWHLHERWWNGLTEKNENKHKLISISKMWPKASLSLTPQTFPYTEKHTTSQTVMEIVKIVISHQLSFTLKWGS